MVLECRHDHPWRFPEASLSGDTNAWLGWPRGRLAELDGIFDIIVCQSTFVGLERLCRSRVAMLQYGLAKEQYNYGAWRSLADLHLAYGDYSAARLQTYAPTMVVGIPAFDRWHSMSFHREVRERWKHVLKPDKPTLAYLPTWGALSTSDEFADAVADLSRDFNVIVKLHHNTAMLHRDQGKRLRGIASTILDQRHDLLEALVVADVALSDYSGSIFDALFCGRPVVLLQSDSQARLGEKFGEDTLEYRRRHDLGLVVESPRHLKAAVQKQLVTPHFPPADLLDQLFDRRAGAVERCCQALQSLANGDLPALSSEQRSRRLVTAAELARERRRSGVTFIEEWWQRVSSLGLAPRTSRHLLEQPRVNGLGFPGDLIDRTSRGLAIHLGRIGWAALGHARQCSRAGRHAEARRTLVLAQRGVPGRPRLMLGIGDAYRDDARPDEAYTYYRAAAAVGGPYEAARKLSFESDWGYSTAGKQTLEQLLRHSADELLPILPMINRVASFYPAHERALQSLRRNARDTWHRIAGKRSADRHLRLAMRCRWLPEVQAVLDAEPSERRHAWARRWVDELGPVATISEAAWHNENTWEEPQALFGGELRPLSAVAAQPIEFFIPGAFFAIDRDEKPTYATIRRTFRSLLTVLASRSDVCIVPRMQTHWRQGRRRLEGLCVTYHTRGDNDPLNLRVQESTLVGRCSFDHSGYAGFSSLANATDGLCGPETVDPARTGEVNRTIDALRTSYARTGQSKYTQAEHYDDIAGPYVFIPLQLVTDPVADLVWLDQLTMLHTVADELADNRVQVVAKRHPYCRSARIDSELGELVIAGKVRLARGSVHRLIAGASAVVTANSGVGLEALIHGKPVIVTGRCDYLSGAHASPSQEQLRLNLKAVLARRAPTLPVENLLERYLCEYTVDSHDVDALRRRVARWLGSGQQ